MFFHHIEGRRKTILAVYMNDMIMSGNNLEEIEKLKKKIVYRICSQGFGIN